jgi:predicted RNase H-like nuclease (RuvC/YqgF family)
LSILDASTVRECEEIQEHNDKLWKKEFKKRWQDREAWRDRKMHRMEREIEDLKRRAHYFDICTL